MRESTKKQAAMLYGLWSSKWPTADNDAIFLITEIAHAYTRSEVSAESCMEEIKLILSERDKALFKGDGNERK